MPGSPPRTSSLYGRRTVRDATPDRMDTARERTGRRPMSWLVTGGAGYIGAYVVRALASAELPHVVLDDLSSGHPLFVPSEITLVEGSILDRELDERTLREHTVEGVIHVAGFKYAGVSVQRPRHTYAQNVEVTRVIPEAMAAAAMAELRVRSWGAI